MEDDRDARISNLELRIEEMERTDSILYGIILGLIAHVTLGGWFWPVFLGAGAAFVYWRFMAERPFSSSDGDTNSGNE